MVPDCNPLRAPPILLLRSLCLQFFVPIPLSRLSSNRCVDCEARLGGAGAKSSGQLGAAAVEYSNTDRGPVCGVGFGCKKNEKGTANGTAVGKFACKNDSSEKVLFVAKEMKQKSPLIDFRPVHGNAAIVRHDATFRGGRCDNANTACLVDGAVQHEATKFDPLICPPLVDVSMRILSIFIGSNRHCFCMSAQPKAWPS